jgi:hypothetical protein
LRFLIAEISLCIETFCDWEFIAHRLSFLSDFHECFVFIKRVYIGRKAYPGVEFVEKIEALAAKKACKIFIVPYANVQSYCGCIANLAVHLAICKSGDPILGVEHVEFPPKCTT